MYSEEKAKIIIEILAQAIDGRYPHITIKHSDSTFLLIFTTLLKFDITCYHADITIWHRLEGGGAEWTIHDTIKYDYGPYEASSPSFDPRNIVGKVLLRLDKAVAEL
jgi:hypothetical protein